MGCVRGRDQNMGSGFLLFGWVVVWLKWGDFVENPDSVQTPHFLNFLAKNEGF